jgi:hypothetical protein
MQAKSIRHINYLLASGVLIAYLIATGWDNLFAVIFLFLFTMSPLVINLRISPEIRAVSASPKDENHHAKHSTRQLYGHRFVNLSACDNGPC